jgi:hypothetical protein
MASDATAAIADVAIKLKMSIPNFTMRERRLTQKLSGGGPMSYECKQDAPPAVR